VAFFDLIPEAINLGEKAYSISTITSLSALGFIIYMILDRFIILHSHTHEEGHEDASPRVKSVREASLSIVCSMV